MNLIENLTVSAAFQLVAKNGNISTDTFSALLMAEHGLEKGDEEYTVRAITSVNGEVESICEHNVFCADISKLDATLGQKYQELQNLTPEDLEDADEEELKSANYKICLVEFTIEAKLPKVG